MSKQANHVLPGPSGGWNVKKAGASKASRHFATKGAAATWARKVSREFGSELVIHKKDGTIAQKDSYGPDPNPPRDRR